MNVLHYYLDLLRNESFANCGQSLSNILNTWRVARNGKVGNENYDGIDFGNISFTDTYIHESANAEFSYKSHLHYYLDLLRDESHYECGYSLFNIINTWKISRDNVICGECFNRIDFGNVPFNGIDFSKDGKMPCSFSNAKLNIYNFRSGHYGIINCATISPDDKYILTGGRDKTAIIWERESGLVHAELNGHTDSIIFVKFSNSGQYCLTASLDNSAILWEVKTGKIHAKLNAHTDIITAIAFSYSDTFCITGSCDHTAIIWEVKTGNPLFELTEHSDEIMSVDFSTKEEKYCVTGSKDNTAIIWEVKTGIRHARLSEHNSMITTVKLSCDGRYCLTGSVDNKAIIWNVNSGTPYAVIKDHTDYITTVAFSKNANLCITGSRDNKAILYDIRQKKIRRYINNHSSTITYVGFSFDDKYFITSSNDKTIIVWDVSSNNSVYNFENHSSIVQAELSTKSSLGIALLCDSHLKVFDICRRFQTERIQHNKEHCYDVGFFPDCRFFVSTSDKGTIIWNIENNRIILLIKPKNGNKKNEPHTHTIFIPPGKYFRISDRLIISDDKKFCFIKGNLFDLISFKFKDMSEWEYNYDEDQDELSFMECTSMYPNNWVHIRVKDYGQVDFTTDKKYDIVDTNYLNLRNCHEIT